MTEKPGTPSWEPWALAARLAIKAQIDANAFLYDADRFVEAYAVYREDCTLIPHPPQRVLHGRAKILERFTHRADGRLGDYSWVRHNISTHWVAALTPDRAETYSYYFVFCDGPISTAGVYHDSWVCDDGTWLIQTREVQQDLTVIGPSAHLLEPEPSR